MSTLFSIFPNVTLLDTIVNLVAILGAILLVYGVLLEAERRQDAVFTVGATCLLVYALWIDNKIFSLAMAGIAIISFIEMLEIVLGVHKHNRQEVNEYKHPEN